MKTKRLFMTACLAAFIVPMSALAGSVAAGQEKSAVCAACHGQTGQSVSPDFPNLGGQHADYLYRALLDYKAGYRKNPIMAAQVENLSRNDMSDLAAFFAAQSGLSVKR